MSVRVEFVKLRPGAVVPVYQTDQAAAVDLHACLDEQITLQPGEVHIIPTGLSIALPNGYEGQVRSRSGLAAKHAVVVLNSPGTLDSDYRGELGVILINHGKLPYDVLPNDRVAQFVVAPHEQVQFQQVESLDDTTRGDGGFGGTGR
ncbi:MAG: dUTP diphosphatase [bacterium]|nr:dUTP diphosphatase [bacterium]